jgi:NAD(P)-dependent dehydrogenase (short-subunit alcohol dehydrogenase family)
MKSFKGKVAAITGAASGIGRALAIELSRRGCHLALSDVNEAGLAETAQLASANGVKVTTAKLNVADRAAVYAWADQVVADHGKVNLIFNNAGVALATTLEDVKPEDFEWIMGINFWGVVWGSQAFLPHLKKTGDGHIINISSLFGLMSLPTQGAYNASKFAVRGYTEALRQELDVDNCGVSATCVHPGGIRTNIARSARMDDKLSQRLGVDADRPASASTACSIPPRPRARPSRSCAASSATRAACSWARTPRCSTPWCACSAAGTSPSPATAPRSTWARRATKRPRRRRPLPARPAMASRQHPAGRTEKTRANRRRRRDSNPWWVAPRRFSKPVP